MICSTGRVIDAGAKKNAVVPCADCLRLGRRAVLGAGSTWPGSARLEQEGKRDAAR